MVRLRLSLGGKKRKPFFKIVACDKRNKRDGKFLEKLGTYDPISKEFKLNKESYDTWISKGASPSESLEKLLKRHLPESGSAA